MLMFYVISQLRQIAKAQQADLTSGTGRQHQATHSTSVVVALQSRLASMTSAFKEVHNKLKIFYLNFVNLQIMLSE